MYSTKIDSSQPPIQLQHLLRLQDSLHSPLLPWLPRRCWQGIFRTTSMCSKGSECPQKVWSLERFGVSKRTPSSRHLPPPWLILKCDQNIPRQQKNTETPQTAKIFWFSKTCQTAKPDSWYSFEEQRFRLATSTLFTHDVTTPNNVCKSSHGPIFLNLLKIHSQNQTKSTHKTQTTGPSVNKMLLHQGFNCKSNVIFFSGTLVVGVRS